MGRIIVNPRCEMRISEKPRGEQRHTEHLKWNSKREGKEGALCQISHRDLEQQGVSLVAPANLSGATMADI